MRPFSLMVLTNEMCKGSWHLIPIAGFPSAYSNQFYEYCIQRSVVVVVKVAVVVAAAFQTCARWNLNCRFQFQQKHQIVVLDFLTISWLLD